MLNAKTCTECGLSSPVDNFRKHPQGKNGLRSKCRPCERARNRRWVANNIEASRKIQREWRRANPEARREYMKERRRADERLVLYGRMQCQFGRLVRGGRVGPKSRRLFDILGYTLEDLMRHLDRQFTKGMTWEALRSGAIHIDHIVPVASFSFTSPEDEEFKACFALTNLRPMWARENQRKSAKRIYLI